MTGHPGIAEADGTTVYVPGSPVRHPRRLIRQLARDLVASRGLAWQLFLRDIRATYRQSILGYVWAFAPVIVTTATFVFLNSQQIIRVGETGLPYPAFVMIGTVLWQTFVDALNGPARAVAGGRGMLTRVNFPREALLLSAIADVLFGFAVRATLLAFIFVFYGLTLHPTAGLALVGVAALVLLGTAIGLLITPLAMLYGDVGRAVTILTGFWMLLTPVVYAMPTSGLGARVSMFNPVSPLLDTTRAWLTGQAAPSLLAFGIVTAAALLALAFGLLLYRVAMPIVIERMGG